MNNYICIKCGTTEGLEFFDWLRRKKKCRNCLEKPTIKQLVMPSIKVSKEWLEMEQRSRERILSKHG